MDDRQPKKGLYDPGFEHDSCGVGFVADLNNVASHDVVRKGIDVLRQPRPPRRPRRRGGHRRWRRHPRPAAPRLLPAGVLGARHLPARTWRLRRRAVLPAARPAHPRRGPLPLRARPRRAGAGGPGLARGAHRRQHPGRHGHLRRAGHLAGHRGPPGQLPHAGRVRATPLRGPQVRHPHGARVGQGRRAVLRLLDVLADDRLQGHAHAPPGAGLLPGPGRRVLRVRPGPHPQPLLDEHAAHLAAGAPLPHAGPQRRDQHAARQRQLDALARGPHRVRALLRGRDLQDAAHHAGGQLRLGHPRQRRGVPHAGRPQPAPRDDDAHPGGVGEGPRDRARCARPSTSTTAASSSPGTGRPRSPSRTAPSSGPPWTATGCDPRATA